MRPFIQKDSTQVYYDGPVCLLTQEELRDYIAGGLADMFQDLRPINVVFKYQALMGNKPGRASDGQLVTLFETRAGVQKAKYISTLKLLYSCRDKCREVQDKAKQGSFARMCAEEDEEELDLLLDICKKNQSVRYQTDEQARFLLKASGYRGAVNAEDDDWEESLYGSDTARIPPHLLF